MHYSTHIGNTVSAKEVKSKYGFHSNGGGDDDDDGDITTHITINGSFLYCSPNQKIDTLN